MRVIVTRVQPQAWRWAQMLKPRFEAVVLPLIEVQALADTSAILHAGQKWASYAAVMFVSSHAVHYFFASNATLTNANDAWTALKTRAWATGPGTRAALLAEGLAPNLVDSPPPEGGQFDSEALLQQVQAQVAPGMRVLIVRGDTQGSDDAEVGAPQSALGQGAGRDWLATRLHQAGVQVDFVVAYLRSAPVWDAAHLMQATSAATDGSVWLFSSAQALTHLKTLLPAQSWAKARAVATHARIAQAARGLGFGVVTESSPMLADVLASIESLA